MTPMDTKKRGNDAQDHTAAAAAHTAAAPPDDKQEAANYEKRTDKGEAIEVENLSSANDEGAP